MRTPWGDGNDYVECVECGHPLESHRRTGCEAPGDARCGCPTRWTVREVEAARAREGLPRRWNRVDY